MSASKSFPPDDPRGASSLDEAARNPDGSYDGMRAFSWLSEVLNPGKGLTVEEVTRLAEKTVAETKAKQEGR